MSKRTPARELKKYVKGTIRYKDGSGTWLESDFIDVRVTESGCRFYVLNEWDATGIPKMVPEVIAERVERKTRRFRVAKLHNFLDRTKALPRIPIQAYVDAVLADDVKRALKEDRRTIRELVEGSLRLYLQERQYLKQRRKKPAAYFKMLPQPDDEEITS